MRWWIVGFALLALACPPAALADGTPEAPFAWTGLYVGINGGYSWGKVSNHLKASSTPGSSSAASISADLDGPIGGGHVGYSWKSQRWVYGVEADFLGSAEDGGISGCSQFRCTTISYGLDWLGTLRGRLGYLLEPRLLLYATGGLAYGHISTDFLSTSAPTGAAIFNDRPQVASDSTTKAGWVVGGGLEMALDRNWMLRAEYFYADLGTIASKSSTSVSASPTGPQCLVETKETLRTDLVDQIFRIGLSYRFAADTYVPLK
ncbi:MAG TPA: outer membrane beta-barrel protein [Hyphomicrobiaceae bacterium]|jgi:outer membrane immunogenic protein|nr:outer membrane beta-barrel protein [Hyphomicrobiaceae bacterium]